jgi:hypothetical protein
LQALHFPINVTGLFLEALPIGIGGVQFPVRCLEAGGNARLHLLHGAGATPHGSTLLFVEAVHQALVVPPHGLELLLKPIVPPARLFDIETLAGGAEHIAGPRSQAVHIPRAGAEMIALPVGGVRA